ncbi:MAG: bifunctional riboflavin kinase/FAD synthetase [Syntrophaceae bacterium]|nr:bifunctional riboflavin kinase/FAD synthetase [Syntrophaceae bacterium]
MKVVRGLEDIPQEFRDAYVTIGNFDGVHLGHIPILKKIIEEAHGESRKALVITFDPHPKKVLHPDIKPFYLITTLEEKIQLLEEVGIDGVILLPFSLEFSKISAEAFVNQILWYTLHIRKIFVGHDYSFGKNKVGNATYLANKGKKFGFGVEVFSAFKFGDETISSTRLRYAILNGNVKMATRLLGRPYSVGGTVIPGKHRGTALGIPTANINPEKELIPIEGVYAVIVQLEDTRYKGVLNIGFNPTFSDNERSIEVYILDFSGNIYGKSVKVFFIDRIRDEVKFDTPEQLVGQIKNDVEQALAMLKPYF